MKTPLSYYGGKPLLANIILGLMPPHRLYCEPFLGGAAIFFAKEPSRVEIINDSNGEIINFYEVFQRDFTALEKEVAISLHSRKQHRQAEVIYQNPDMFDRIKRAWAIWVLVNSSYGCMLDGGYGYDRTGGNSKKLDNKRAGFKAENVGLGGDIHQRFVGLLQKRRLIRDTGEFFRKVGQHLPA
ncbi:MAG: DNA adenine methylase, partial [Treponema sp.]|nr:DNA adenine methylase [Treponema sp.]